MKSCENNSALLDLYIDGELSPQEAAQVREHLHICARCRTYVQSCLAIREAFPDAEDTQVPDGFSDGVMAAIRANAAPRRSGRSRWARTLLPLAACFAVVVLAVAGLPQLRDNVVTTSPEAQIAADDTSTASQEGSDPAGVAENTRAALSGGSDKSSPDDAQPPEANAPSQESGTDPSVPQQGVEEALSPAGGIRAASAAPEADASNDTASTPALFSAPPSLTLSADAAGDLLSDYTPVSVENGTQVYSLSAEEYTVLLEHLSERGLIPAEAPSAEDASVAGAVSVYVISA